MAGTFVAQHKDEIFKLVRSVEETHRVHDPEDRVTDIEERKDGTLLVWFNSARLARSVGEALYGRYWGELELEYRDEGRRLRIAWWR